MRRILVSGLLGVLAACGGSGGSNTGTPGDGSAVVSHADHLRALDAAAARLQDLDFTATAPARGSATYAGHLGANAVFGEAPLLVTAGVVLTARFEAGTISGTFADARSADGTVSGSGRFEDGSIGPAGITAGVTGTLARSGTAYAVEGEMRGAFLGSAAQGIAGAIEAELRRGGTPAGRFDAELWAER